MPTPIFDRPATTPEDAFVRFVNALHWAVDLDEVDLGLILDADRTALEGPLAAVLAWLEPAEHRLVIAFIAELTDGGYTFSEARAIWKRAWSDRSWSDWHDPAGLLCFLLAVRDAIDPHARPISEPRFRPEPGRTEPKKPGGALADAGPRAKFSHEQPDFLDAFERHMEG